MVLQQVLDYTKSGGDVTSVRELWDNVTLTDVTDSSQGLQGSQCDLTSLWVGNSGEVVLQTWKQLVQEWSDNLWVVNELTHVVDDNSRLTLN